MATVCGAHSRGKARTGMETQRWCVCPRPLTSLEVPLPSQPRQAIKAGLGRSRDNPTSSSELVAAHPSYERGKQKLRDAPHLKMCAAQHQSHGTPVLAPGRQALSSLISPTQESRSLLWTEKAVLNLGQGSLPVDAQGDLFWVPGHGTSPGHGRNCLLHASASFPPD